MTDQERHKKLIVPNDKSNAGMLLHANNRKKFGKIIDKAEGNLFFDEENEKRFEVMGNLGNGLVIKTDTKEELDKILKRLVPTAQKALFYVISYSIHQGYKKRFQININEFFEVLGMTRKTSNIDRLLEYLQAFKAVSFKCTTEIWEKSKTGKRKAVRKEKLDSYIITDIIRRTRGSVTTAIEINLGEWIEYLKMARDNDDAQLLTLPLNCLKVDVKHYPYSFGCAYRMAQYARTNAKTGKEWHTLSFKEILSGSEPWEHTEKELNKRGINGKDSVLERFTRSLEHAEPAFKLQWEWVGKEPTKRSELETAKIKFRFLEPLKNADKETPAV